MAQLLAVLAALLATSAAVNTDGTAAVLSASEFVAALNDERVLSVRLAANIKLEAADFPEPVHLARNLTIEGGSEDPSTWSTLDLNYVRGKIVFTAPVVLNVQWIVLDRFTLLPIFQYPGMDIFAVYNASAWAAQQQQGGTSSNSSAAVDLERVPLIRMTGTGMVQRPCLPPSFLEIAGSLQAVSKLLCPEVVQHVRSFSQDNCTNSSSAPAFSQCWVAKQEGSTSSYGSAPTDTFGVGIPAYYSVCITKSYQLCGSVMTDECISSSGGLVACYFRMQNQGQQEYSLRDEAVRAASSPPPPAAVEPSTAVPPGGNGGGGGGQTTVLAAAVAGAVGGVALLVVLLAVLLYVRRRRHQRKPADSESPRAHSSPCSVRSIGVCEPSAIGAVHNGSGYTSAGMDPEDLACKDLASVGLKSRGSNPHAPPTPAVHGEATLASSSTLSQDLLPGDRKQASPPLPRKHHASSRPDSVQLELLTPKSPFVAGIEFAVSVHEESHKEAGPKADGVLLSDMTLGKGAYGRVVKGTYHGQPVAVKLLNFGLLSPASPTDGPISVEPVATPAAGGSTSSTCPVVSTEPGACPPAAAASADVNLIQAATPAGGNSAQAAPAAVPSDKAHGLTMQERALRQEVEVLARCQHPNIVRLLAANLTPHRVCLVMELMECSLERVLYGSGAQPLPLQTVLHIGVQVANALAYLHPTVLHRDLKPANILISAPHSERPIVKIADFGISRLLTSVLITANPEVGTAAYMANETFDLGNSVITDRVDIYSLAVILWEMLAAQRPWAEYTSIVALAYRVAICNERPPTGGLLSRAPAKLINYVNLMWSAEPLRRPAAAEVAKTLLLISQQRLAAGNYAEEGDRDLVPASKGTSG